MKRSSTLFTFSLLLFTSSAAVPLTWTVETSRATPAQFEAYQGETLNFEAALTSRGKPLELSGMAALYWQTNGMGSAYWESTAAVNSNRLSAVFTPEMDVGAKVYNCFIGIPGTIYHAAFQLRLRPSPGALPNVLPLPVPVIDFAKVRVLNPPWSGGGGGVDTNAVRDIIHDTVDGAARPLPKYLHIYNADDDYLDAAQEYYRSRGDGKTDGGCSSVSSGGFLYRNFDYPFDDRAEFVVRMSAGQNVDAASRRVTPRYASIGVAQVGTNLTEQMVTSGKPEYSRLYKWLPGATVDGINENGVACNINVCDGNPQTSGWHNDTGDLHPLAAVRWILDNATNAQHAAEYIASHIAFPAGWTQNFHYMVADEEKTWVVQNGYADELKWVSATFPILTNFIGRDGAGQERWDILAADHTGITNAWYTNAYRRETNPPWVSDLAEVIDYTNEIFNAWAEHPKEYFRGRTTNGIPWWQTVHTSVYDLTNRVLRVAVQETDDWYVFQVPSSGAKVDAYTKAETDEKLAGKASVYDDGFIDDRVQFIGKLTDRGGAPIINARDRVLDGGDWYLGGDIITYEGNSLDAKADRADSTGEVLDDEIATLDEDGNPTRSGIGIDGNVVDFGGSKYPKASYADFEVAFIGYVLNYGSRLEAQAGTYYYPFDPNYSSAAPEFKFPLMSDIPDVSGKADRSMISATDQTFSNAVLSVGINTNLVASIGELNDFIHGYGELGATSLGGLVLALLGAAALLRKKTKLLKSDGTAEDEFATDLLGKQVAISAIDARIKTNAESAAEPTNAVTLNDNAPKTVTVASATSPATPSLAVTFGAARNGGLRICELYILNGTVDTDLTFDAETVSFVSMGDSFPACEAGINYFVFAEVAANLWKVTRETLKSITTPTPVAAA